MSNLRLINETEITSATATVQAQDVFSSDFDIYKITISDLQQASATTKIFFRYINSAGSPITASKYDYAFLVLKDDDSFAEQNQVDGSEIWHTGYNIENTTDFGGSVFWIFNPYSSSSYTFHINQSFGRYSGVSGGGANFEGYKQIGALKNLDTVTGIEFYNTSSVDFSKLKFNIYGLRVDS